jgi:hypothetical protein
MFCTTSQAVNESESVRLVRVPKFWRLQGEGPPGNTGLSKWRAKTDAPLPVNLGTCPPS